MHRFLTQRVIRFVAVVTMCGTFLPSVAPALGHQAPSMPYVDWLREQLRVPEDMVLERTLESVSKESFRHVQAFLTVVVSELESSGENVGRFFGVDGLEGLHLVSHLESRFSHLTPDALPARTQLTIAPAPTISTDRLHPSVAPSSTPTTLHAVQQTVDVTSYADEQGSTVTTTPVRPRGP